MDEKDAQNQEQDQSYLLDKQVDAPGTIGEDGDRRWIYPNRRPGVRASKRRSTAIFLILFYFFAPWLSVGSRPLLRVDVLEQSASIFGIYLPMSEYNYIFFLLAPLALALFLVTALRGRIWCGYACPQTVFVEWIIRPIEELIEGSALKRMKLDQEPASLSKISKKIIKHALFLLVSVVVANAFLGFFVDPNLVLSWIISPPSKHPTAFAFVVFVTLLMYFDLAWFREQFCSFLCPYARFQSVMLDNDSPSVAYNSVRGEPRGRAKDESKGDCIDCQMCVRVCPTGIDIRNGLQLECIQCERCIDACDSVMANLHRQVGLISIETQSGLAGKSKVVFYKRPRVIAYVLAILLVLGLGGITLFKREDVSITLLRQPGSAYSKLDTGKLSNIFGGRAINHTDHEVTFDLSLVNPPKGVHMICPRCGIKIEAYGEEFLPVLIVFELDSKLNKVWIKTSYGDKLHELPILRP